MGNPIPDPIGAIGHGFEEGTLTTHGTTK